VLCICAVAEPDAWYQARAPYVISPEPTTGQRISLQAEYVAKRLAGRAARFAGDLMLSAQTRTFGLAYEDTPGQAGLHTTRLEVVYASAALPGGTPARLDYRDRNYAGRIGWKEIVLRAGPGARVDSASVPGTTISDELRSYPKDLLQSPLDVTRARAEIVSGSEPGIAPTVLSRAALQARVGVRPRLELVAQGTLPRTEFKAKRVIDDRDLYRKSLSGS